MAMDESIYKNNIIKLSILLSFLHRLKIKEFSDLQMEALLGMKLSLMKIEDMI